MNLKQQLKHTWKWIIMPFSGSSDTVLLFFLSEKSQKDWIKESKNYFNCKYKFLHQRLNFCFY